MSEDKRGQKRPRVALLIESSNAYGRGLLSGIIDYMRCHESWTLYVPEQGRGDSPSPKLQGWNLDGMIARVENEAIASAVRELHIPVVDVSAARLLPDAPWVETDDSAIAQLAFDHLTERGYKNFAFVGDTKFNWSRWRAFGFRRCVDAVSGQYFEFPVGHSDGAQKQPSLGSPQILSGDESEETLAAWLKSLPKPIGIVTAYDIKGQQILNLCRDLSISVPEEVSILGIDNDPLICELCDPTMSSIVPDAKKAGYIAAEILDALLTGRTAEITSQLIKPLNVHARQSTEIQAIDDEIVAQAMKLIRKHACEGLSVTQLIENLPVSRRIFENRFQKAIGYTPHAEIVRVRMQRVKYLLSHSEHSVSDIARMTGYAHDEYLSSSFKQLEGMSPTQYRQQHRQT